jgi:ketosteroid isomerase-like protein
VSRENVDPVELIRETCATWSRGDLDATLGLIAGDARWEPSGKFIGSGQTYEGHEGVQRFWAVFREPWLDISLEPIEFTTVDDSRVLTRTRFRGTGRASGIVTETELFVVWTVESGKVTRYQSFGERADALGAAGLSE